MKEKFLIIILRVSGLLLVTAFIAVFLPYETMTKIHRQIGLGEMPQLPILAYLARSVSLFYAIHGIILLYISFYSLQYESSIEWAFFFKIKSVHLPLI